MQLKPTFVPVTVSSVCMYSSPGFRPALFLHVCAVKTTVARFVVDPRSTQPLIRDDVSRMETHVAEVHLQKRLLKD